MLRINDLRLRIAGKELLDKLNLQVGAGEKVALRGPSGCGKSTLLSALLGFIPPVSGSIHMNGVEVIPANLRAIRKMAAWVPQFQPAFSGSLREWLLTPLQFKANRHIVNPPHRINELFEQFLLDTELLDKPQDKLSGGEKQRMALISAVLLQRDLVLLDEPTASLDEKSKQAVLDYFCKTSEATVIMVAHDEYAIKSAERVVTLTPSDRRDNHGDH